MQELQLSLTGTQKEAANHQKQKYQLQRCALH
jgi:hypothetical protein